jgi:hypothetical protein
MISRYIEIDLDEADAGMVLCTEVLDHQGSVLLPKGAILSDALITSLRRRGIDTLHVVNDAISEQELAEERERVLLRLASLFRNGHPEPASAFLKQQVTDYHLKKIQ